MFILGNIMQYFHKQLDRTYIPDHLNELVANIQK